jgi:hypothetical protein
MSRPRHACPNPSGWRDRALAPLWILMLGLVNFGGCGATGKSTVLEAPTAGAFRATAVTIVELPPTVEMPDKHRALLRKSIDDVVTGKDGLPAGPGLRINYRIVQFDKGSRFERHLWHGIGRAGEGSVTVEADYYGPPTTSTTQASDDDAPVARTRIESRIQSGLFGGSFREVYDRVAHEIRAYTVKNFK